MEVHAHSHTARKKWTHYLWEFLMLFLAVFCGFLAENQREHMVEHRREKEYIHSIREDLKQDTAQLKQIIEVVNEKIRMRDSLLKTIASRDIMDNSASAYYYFVASYHFPDFIYNDRTIQQLKNGGNMRLIRNSEVSNGIMDYDSKVRTLFIHQDMMNSISLQFTGLANQLFQKRSLDTALQGSKAPRVPLMIRDRNKLEEFYNNMSDQRLGFIRLKMLDEELLKEGEKLMKLINGEYHLE